MKRAITIMTCLFLLMLVGCEIHSYPSDEVVLYTTKPSGAIIVDSYHEYCYELDHVDCCVYYDYYNTGEICEVEECYHYITQDWYEGELCWYE